MAAYRVVLTPAAERQLAKMPHQAREMVAAVLVALGTNPRPTGCIKLSGTEDLWRIRVRQYRVIYQILDAELIVTIVKVGDRKDVYRRHAAARQARAGSSGQESGPGGNALGWPIT